MSILSFLRHRYTALATSNNNSANNTPSLTAKLTFQIVLLQIFYYLTACIIFFVTSMLLGWQEKSGLVFSWKDVSIENSFGLTLIFLWLLNSLLSVGFITFIIGRSKLVWDFALTIHILNLLIVSLVNGIPKNIYWWILQILSVTLMIVLGTYATRWVELRDTFFENITDIEMGSK